MKELSKNKTEDGRMDGVANGSINEEPYQAMDSVPTYNFKFLSLT